MTKTTPKPLRPTQHEENVVAFCESWADLIRDLRAARESAGRLRIASAKVGRPDRPAGKSSKLTLGELGAAAALAGLAAEGAIVAIAGKAPPFILRLAVNLDG